MYAGKGKFQDGIFHSLPRQLVLAPPPPLQSAMLLGSECERSEMTLRGQVLPDAQVRAGLVGGDDVPVHPPTFTSVPTEQRIVRDGTNTF